MITVDTSDFDDLDKELMHELSKDIVEAVEAGAMSVVRNSPVKTGRFKGNWSVSIDNENDTAYETFDKQGSSTLSTIKSELEHYNISRNDIIYLQNNVEDDTGDNYAETVGFDLTGSKAEKIINRGTAEVVRAL